ncbi:hypothetical protein [Nonomuraea indica]|uniref:hypothetical protein n=1 Tax=Nonomuraea indica TaxID=1581193 RepID=UPI000C7B3962|nr:hypothetical protein [Nonomuraea indica]
MAREHRITLDAPLPNKLVAEFTKRVFFADESILDFRLAEGNSAVLLTTTEAADPADLARKLGYLLRNDVLPQLVRAPKVVWRSPVARVPASGTFDRLAERGVVHLVGEGQVALGEPLLTIMDALDATIRRIVLTEFGGREFRYPTLIPTTALARCGYFTSFPQYAMFATRITADLDVYRDFLDAVKNSGDPGAEILSRCGRVDYCLPPTMCYHTFHQFADRALPGGMAVATARGKSFRHESRYSHTLARLWDFTIREVVFFGTRDEALGLRERFLRRSLDLAEELEVSGSCEVANDPFFGDTDSGDRSSSQRLMELKYELGLRVDEEESIAVASFNFHERFFGEAFAIAGTPFTACAGFGLERFAFALVCQHGPDPDRWPATVRRALNLEVAS